MAWHLWVFLISSGTRAQPAKTYHLRKLALPFHRQRLNFKQRASATMVLGSGIPYRMKYVIGKLCLCLISLFQPIGQMAYNNIFVRVIGNARIVLIMVVTCSIFTARKPNINIGPEYARIRIGARRVYRNVSALVLTYSITADSKYTCRILLESGVFSVIKYTREWLEVFDKSHGPYFGRLMMN